MKRKLYYILYLVLITALCLLGIELYLNYLLNNPEKSPKNWQATLSDYYHLSDASFIQQESEMARYDDGLFYTLRPGEFVFENREFSNEFQVNNAGLRDDEASLEYPKVIMLGDSYGMGWGIDQQKTYAQLVEKEAELTVLNAGISSYGTPRELLMLDRLKTDSLQYLIVQFCKNDIVEINTYLDNNNRLPISSEDVYDSVCQAIQSSHSYYPFKHCFQLLPHLFNEQPILTEQNTKTQKKQKSKDSQRIHRGFLQLLKNSKKIPENTQIILFQLDAKADSGYYFMKTVKSILDREMGSSLQDRVSFIDFSTSFGDQHYFILDEHINEKGHRVVADSLVQFIKNDRPVKHAKEWLYDSGKLCIKAEYLGKIKHGKMECFWENGTLSLETHYKNGYKHGEEVHYDQSGEVVYRKVFINGKEQ